jgi:crotonobetainyl-CoA:carnitine CoA-transferase CaiB-like acyl-CoA transferase
MARVNGVLKTPRTNIGVAKALDILRAADIPCARCERRDSLMENLQIQAIGALETYVTDTLGKQTLPTPPIQFAGAATSQAEPSPMLGEHSRAILLELEWSETRINSLVEQKILQSI